MIWSLAPRVSDLPVPLATPSPDAPSPWLHLWAPLLAATLLVGVAIRLTLLCLGLARLRHLHRHAEPIAAPSWLLALRAGVAPRATIIRSALTGSPATFGFWRPIVILPPALESMNRQHQEAIVLHELLHARSGHWLAILCEELLKAFVFFHPVVHWLVAGTRLAREQAVDAEVVRRLGRRDAYLDSLIEVARLGERTHAALAAPFLRESHLRERVALLLKEASMSRFRAFAYVSATAAALALATAWAVSAVPLRADQAGGATTSSPPIGSKAEPTIVKTVNPTYPADAYADKVEGVFLVELVIGTDGIVADARISASAATRARLDELRKAQGSTAALEGDPRLAAAALDAVRQWRFEPAVRDGKPVESRATAPVTFAIF